MRGIAVRCCVFSAESVAVIDPPPHPVYHRFMPKPNNKTRVPTEDEILAAILQVKPTADMPRPGVQPSKKKPK